MREFQAEPISVSMGERNPAFLLLPQEIEILYVEENQLFFFCKENVLHQTIEKWAV